MPEGDTVWRTAHRLDSALRGAELTRSDLRWPSVAEVDVRGATTVEVVPRGKHLLHRLDMGLTIHSHLRMEGQWRVVATPELTERTLADHTLRAALGTRTWTALGLRLGMLDIVPTAAEATLVGHLGPDVLDPEARTADMVAAVRGCPGTIAEALLDQRLLAGVGTFYACESLFLTGTHPWSPAARLDPESLSRIIERARALMRANLPHAVQSTTGLRAPGQRCYVHGRLALPCRRCGEPVRVSGSSGIGPARAPERTIFYCPTCQGGLAPSDQGEPQRPLGANPRRGVRQRTQTPRTSR